MSTEFAPRLETPDFREDISPFIAFCNTVKIESSMKVVSSLTPIELDIVNHLGARFPYPTGEEKLIQSLWGNRDTVIFDRDQSLYINVSRLREKIGRFQDGAVALYRIYGFKQYLLSPKLEVDRWILPQDRAEKLQEFKEEVRPLMEYCFQVQTRNSKYLIPRLSPLKQIVAEMLGMEYSEKVVSWVTKRSIIQKVWGDRDGVVIDDHNEWQYEQCFWTTVCRSRKIIRQFNNGNFDIESDWQRGNYRLASAD
jgi:hypothetical protein